MKLALAMVDRRGGYLYEHRPDLFPEGYLTQDEIGLWCLYYEDLRARNG